MAGGGLYAQSVFVDQDEEVVTVPITTDTVVVQQSESTQTQVLERTWGVDLEDYLRDKIVYLSKHPTEKKVSKQELRYVYRVCQVPCQAGKQVVFLSMTKSKEFYLSKQDPLEMAEICSCYLDLHQPQMVTEPRTPSRTRADDPKNFGEVQGDGPEKDIKNLW